MDMISYTIVRVSLRVLAAGRVNRVGGGGPDTAGDDARTGPTAGHGSALQSLIFRCCRRTIIKIYC